MYTTEGIGEDKGAGQEAMGPAAPGGSPTLPAGEMSNPTGM